MSEKLKTVGIKELKDKFSQYIREVRSGTRILITDRSEVVASLASPRSDEKTATAFSPALDLWVASNLIRLPNCKKTELKPTGLEVAEGTVASLLDSERGD